MGSAFSIALKTGLPFGIVMAIVFSIRYDLITGCICGMIAGVMFGGILAAFISVQAKKFTAERPLLPDETLIKEGGANHFVGLEAVGGWIYLTDSRFYFKSHGSNFQDHEYIVALNQISNAEKTNSFGIIPNGLKLTLKDQTVEKFVVNGSNDWVKTIKTLI